MITTVTNEYDLKDDKAICLEAILMISPHECV